MSNQTTDTAKADPAHLAVDPDLFAENFDRRPFYVKHDLANHPLFQLPAIAALSQRLPENLLDIRGRRRPSVTRIV